jgi:hypothetical protein
MKHQKQTKKTKGKISLFFVAIKDDFFFEEEEEEKKHFFFWLLCVSHLLNALTFVATLVYMG